MNSSPSHPHAAPSAESDTHPHAVGMPPREGGREVEPKQGAGAEEERTMQMAIVDSNMLACMGLMHILKKVISVATVKVYHSYEELMEDNPEIFAHFFVSSRIYFEHTQFFRQRAYQTIVLINGENIPPMPGILTLNISQTEQALITDLLQMHSHGHGKGSHTVRPRPSLVAGRQRTVEAEGMPEGQALTAREIEVVTLLGKGYINKEIADRLNIGLTTVITHRKNIMSKINAHSLSDVIIYAVMNGHLDLGE